MKKCSQSISLLHPFSAKAIGLKEHDLYYSHSKSQELALQKLEKDGYRVFIEYFTQRIFPYKKTIDKITKRFWPVTYPLIKKRARWRKQYSKFHEMTSISDVTIINMSGHGSGYTFHYAKKLQTNSKPYIAMVGGVNMTLGGLALNYYKNAHHLLVHTSLQKQHLQENNEFAKLDIRVLPLGIDTSLFQPKFSLERKPTHDFQLLYVGRLSRLKRIEIALETISFLKKNNLNVKLNLIGFTSDIEYKTELITLINELGIQQEVNFLGAKQQSELVAHYQQADLLLLPSEHESFGMVMVEAMACGTGVIAIEGSGGPEEVIINGRNGYVCPKDNYAQKILELLQNEEELTCLKEKAVEVVQKSYSVEATYTILKKSIEDCLH